MSTQVLDNSVVVQGITVDGIDFGRGRYSSLTAECYRDAKRIFKLEQPKAEKLARQITSEIGAHFASAPVTVKLGKLNSKENKLTLSEASKVKNVTQTWAILALRTMGYVNDAKSFGINDIKTSWVLDERMAVYLKDL